MKELEPWLLPRGGVAGRRPTVGWSAVGVSALLGLATVAARPAAAESVAPLAPPAAETAVEPAPPRADRPTLFIAGDSTAARGRGEAQQGWGVPFADFFDLERVNVVNRARGGRSSRTFVTEGLWDRLREDLKPGDIVLLQFGHNDGGPINADRARGSLPGLGEQTEKITHVQTGAPETVHTFGWYVRRMIDDTKAAGASAIVVSPTLRNRWIDGRIERGTGDYREWSFAVAKAAAVPFIDLTGYMADQFDAAGEPRVAALYPQDHTHFNAAGAQRHAAAVVAGLKGLRPSPVEGLLSPQGEAVAPDRFAWLRLPSPWRPQLPSVFLVGDSTVRQGRGDGAEGGQWGWGDFLGEHLALEHVNLVNRAVGGTGVRSFRDSGYWDAVLGLIKPGDVVMIQFGHNDNGPRAPVRGIGGEVEERAHPVTGETSPMHTWGWYLRRYVEEARAAGATPIVCSLIPRKIWRDGRIARTADSHADWARAVAAEMNAPFVDLHEIIARRYDELGPEKVDAFFADERVHTSAAGAAFNARGVIEGLRALPENPLAAYLRPEPRP